MKVDNVKSIINEIKIWQENFFKNKLEILKQNKNKKLDDLVDLFLYTNLSKSNPKFCSLFKINEKCHQLDKCNLNCFACDCPNFDVSNSPIKKEEKIYIGRCKINSKAGKYIFLNSNENKKTIDKFIWDCSDCHIPHSREFVKKEIRKLLKNL